jgi:hypothetical protein
MLTLTANSAVASGTYSLTLNATGGSLSASAPASLTVAPLASFHLNASFSGLVVRQGGSTSGVFDIVIDSGSTNFSVNMSVTGLPSEVTAAFTQNPLPATGGQQSVTLTASSDAAPIQNATLVIMASRPVDGAFFEIPFTLTVAPPPGNLPANRTGFVRTDDTPSSIVYDSVHNLIYAALPDLESVDLIDPVKGQVVRSIPVPEARGLSLSPDGTRIVVSGYAQQVAWIDTGTQQIIQRNILPPIQADCCASGFVSPGPPFIMASGKVLFESNTLFYDGILEWDAPAGQISGPISFNGTETLLGVRSVDGTKALFSNDDIPSTVSLFDSAKDSFVATTTFSNYAFSLAANPTGTQFAVAVNMQPIFILDNQLNTLGQAPVGGIVSGMVYSPDGKYLYIVSTPGQVPLISTIDCSDKHPRMKAISYPLQKASCLSSVRWQRIRRACFMA